MTEITMVCDCPTKDALVCKEHPDCRPSYCKMRRFDPPVFMIDLGDGDGPNGLKACPFCGAEAKIGGKATVLVQCTKCTAATFQRLKDTRSAISNWNRRSASIKGADGG